MKLFQMFGRHPGDPAGARKARVDKLLRSKGNPVNQWQPVFGDLNDIRFRTGQDVAARVLVLTYLIYIGEVREDRTAVLDFLAAHNLWAHVSGHERALFGRSDWSEQEEIDVSWRREVCRLLLWTLGKIDRLEIPTGESVAVDDLLASLPGFLKDPTAFIQAAALRSPTEILDCAELTFRLHWSVRDAELNGRPIPAELQPGVIRERHQAVHWVMGFGADWDAVPIDT